MAKPVTFTLPTGEKVKTATQSRFALIRHSDASEGSPAHVSIVKRSSSMETLKAERRRRGFRTDTRFFVGDTVDGSLVVGPF